jgi:rhamnose utilization protein RhaD (predicted bifunctional aldolase and dehydrogenase)
MTPSAAPASLDNLVAMSHALGAPAADCAILGEGNVSMRVDAETFWVKGSGCQLGTMGGADFVQLRFAPLLDLLAGGACDEAKLQEVYARAKLDPNHPRRPSVEAVFHAMALTCPGVQVVAHTHPTAILGLVCSARWRELLRGRLFPDEAVVLGKESVLVEYVDPGVELAKAIKRGIDEFAQRHGAPPKAIFMQNHGFIALAKSTTEAEAITAMAVKAARIRAIAATVGGLNDLGEAVADHLINRPDEKHRQRMLA